MCAVRLKGEGKKCFDAHPMVRGSVGLKCQVIPVSSYPLKNLTLMFQIAGVPHIGYCEGEGLCGCCQFIGCNGYSGLRVWLVGRVVSDWGVGLVHLGEVASL